MPAYLSRPSRVRRALAAALAAGLAGALVACGDQDDTLRTPEGAVISTVTTRIASVNIVNPARDWAQTCLAPTAADPGAPDVTRVVVTDPTLLDAVCALGLGAAVTAVTADAGSVPEYLGPQLAAVPAIGDRPSAQQVTEAAPQVVLTTAETAADAAAMKGTGGLGDARVVTVPAPQAATDFPGANWRDTFTQVAAALSRTQAGAERLTEFDTEAARVGRVMDAVHTQVSLVRFTPENELLQGTENFGASILAQVGAQRPTAQRGPEPTVVTDANFADADADLIYISAEGDRGRDRAIETLDSERWQTMGAPSWKRVLWLDDALWYRSSGLAAAWLVLNDVKSSLNGSSAGD